jgi:hypothetical protein
MSCRWSKICWWEVSIINAIIVLSGELAESVTLEKAINMNEYGYAVTVEHGTVRAEREDQKYKCFILKENAADTRPGD